MITSKGEIKLMDFGIAKGVDNNSATQTGTFMGSPSYMSPEQVRGKDVDARSDIYSLGILFYEIATGRLPFTGNSTHDLIIKIAAGKFIAPNLINTKMPAEINKLIMEMMAKDKLDRPESIESIRKHLDHILTAKGFVESHVELERYFKDRISYESKLKQMEKKIASYKAKNDILNKSNMISTITKKPRIKKPVHKTVDKTPKKPPRPTVAMQKPQAIVQRPREIPQKPRMIPVPVVAQKKLKKKTNPPRPNRTAVFIPKNNTVNQRPNSNAKQNRPVRRIVVRQQKRPFSQTIVNLLLVCVIALGTMYGYKKWKNKKGSLNFFKNKKTTKILSTKKQSKTRKKRIAKRRRTTTAPKKKTRKPLNVRKKPTKRIVSQKINPPKTIQRKNNGRKNTPQTTRNKKDVNKQNNIIPTKKQTKDTQKRIETLEEKELEENPTVNDSFLERVITVKSKPAAKIYIKGKYQGTTIDSIYASKKIKVTELPITVELRRDGYQTFSKKLFADDFHSKNKMIVGPITLKKSKKTNSTKYKLKISSNQKNIEVKILNLKSKELFTEIQKNNRESYDLDYGKYEVVVIWKEQVITRRLSLTGRSKNVSFHGEFQ